VDQGLADLILDVTDISGIQKVALGFVSRAAAVVVEVELIPVVKASKRLGDIGWDRERCPPNCEVRP